jgi:hypothetical protein
MFYNQINMIIFKKESARYATNTISLNINTKSSLIWAKLQQKNLFSKGTG